MRTMIKIIVAVFALTVQGLGHAEQSFFPNAGEVKLQDQNIGRQIYDMTYDKIQDLVEIISSPIVQIDTKEYNCLARNIFFEAGAEPLAGKVAVGLVTINRTQDGRFKKTICGVVNQQVTANISKNVIVTKQVQVGWFGSTKEEREELTVWKKVTICQFSWRCMFVRDPKSQDPRWLESQRVARELLERDDSYSDLRGKFSNALYFHSAGVRPGWAGKKEYIGRIGGHKFYQER